jgi:hypothetical protein
MALLLGLGEIRRVLVEPANSLTMAVVRGDEYLFFTCLGSREFEWSDEI